MSNIAFINGKFLSPNLAKISVWDRGLIFGDSVYEVIRSYKGKPFLLADHLSRLKYSADQIKIPLPYKEKEIKEIIREGLRKSGYKDATIYLQLTRGTGLRKHTFPSRTEPTFIVLIYKLPSLPTRFYQNGVAAITLPDIRWLRCDIKSTNLLPNVLAKEIAKRKGAEEAIFIRNGFVTEGASSNIFVFVDGDLITPALSQYLLAGTVRKVIIEISPKIGLGVRERKITLKELYKAKEVFLTSTTFEILPIVKIDGQKIGKGKPDQVTKRLHSLFKELVNNQI